ncbi:hypothetical protein FKM82_020278 [Ascaphus truei]
MWKEQEHTDQHCGGGTYHTAQHHSGAEQSCIHPERLHRELQHNIPQAEIRGLSMSHHWGCSNFPGGSARSHQKKSCSFYCKSTEQNA